MTTNTKKKLICSILISSDRAASGVRPDKTTPMLVEKIESMGIDINATIIVPDNKDSIVSFLNDQVNKQVNLIITSGGTGLAPSDVTPEATREVIERRVPGMEEAMRRYSFNITPLAVLSRGLVGVVGSTLIVNLPGNPKGSVENLEALEPVLKHALRLIRGDKVDK